MGTLSLVDGRIHPAVLVVYSDDMSGCDGEQEKKEIDAFKLKFNQPFWRDRWLWSGFFHIIICSYFSHTSLT